MADIISIRRRPARQEAPPSLPQKISRGPVADKFFVSGLLAGFLGSVYLGVHLWLMRSGGLTPWSWYAHGRMLHAQLQLYLFLGMFVLGFSFQAAGPTFSAPAKPPAWSLLCALLPACAMIAAESTGIPAIFSLGVMVSYLAGALYLLTVSRRARPETNKTLGLLLVAALACTGASAWMDVSETTSALLVVWACTAMPIIAVAPQFLRNVLGGAYPSPARARLLTALAVLTLIAGTAWRLTLAPWCWDLFAGSALASLLCFAMVTRASAAVTRLPSVPLAPAFVSAFFWAFAGAAALFAGPANADAALHLWVLGWASTLIIAVSLHIAGFIAGQHLSRPQVLVPLIALWQLVPFGRGVVPLLGLAAFWQWITAAAASIVFVIWLSLLLRASFRIMRRQGQLRKGEALPC